jgi:2,4-dienoyl-CoA reductase (NADPH2)
MTAETRLCLSCNQECVGRMGLNRWLGCIENPMAGRESVLPAPVRRPEARSVLIVGAGPAGLQSAISAAEHGHRVTVVERDTEAGGNVRWAASVPSRAELGDIVRNQLHECERLGVAIEYGVDATTELIESRAPDDVVIAAGSVAAPPYWVDDLRGDIRFATAIDVLKGDAEPSGRVLVVDDIGFHHATSVAELLADRGCSVEIATGGMVVGQDLGVTLDMENWWMRAAAKGIQQSPNRLITVNAEGDLELMDHRTSQVESRGLEWVVAATHHRPADALYHDLLARRVDHGIEVHRVGDAVAPRRIHAAVVDGDRVGRMVGQTRKVASS